MNVIQSLTHLQARLFEWIETRRRRREFAQLNERRFSLAQCVFRKGRELLCNTPPDRRSRTAVQYGALFEHVCPGVTVALLEIGAKLSAQDHGGIIE